MPEEVQQFITGSPSEMFSQALEVYRVEECEDYKMQFQESHNRQYQDYLASKIQNYET